MSRTSSIILLIFLVSCKNETSKNVDIIEIYTPKKPIASYLGESIVEYPNIYNQLLQDAKGTSFIVDTNIVKVDSITKQVYYANKFKSTEKDLSNNPLINSSEIKGINFETNEIVFSESGSKKIRTIKQRVKYCNQFMVTVNRKSIINGYLVNSLTSNYVYGYQILYVPTIKFKEKTIDNKNQEYFIEYYSKEKGLFKPNLKKNTELYKAFKDNNKILK
ncbi:hypothetical protein [Flavobacterium sp. XGLA_31]|uniref:hypothetical protein n=1 Tax=Flavobacterium sp. XGLA_31 TaxID=3447666 RepID=UPI003F3A9773